MSDEISFEDWLALQAKPRVYKSGPDWRYDHACIGRGGTVRTSYPFFSQPVALTYALGHLNWCVGLTA